MAKPKDSAPPAKKKGVSRIPVLQLRLGPNLRLSYIHLIRDIYVEIARKLREEQEGLPTSSDRPRVYKKLFTPSDGIFLVELIPEDPEAQVLTLLFRFKDLYFESYHFNGVWYRLSDHGADLPPKYLVPYTDIVMLRGISTCYANLGGYCKIGKPAFHKCYAILSCTDVLMTSQRGHALLRSGPLSLPANGISEAVRFRIMERWVKGTLKGELDRRIPPNLSMYFTEWGDLSTSMYTKQKLPSCCRMSISQMQKQMGVLKRRDMVEVIEAWCLDDKPPAFVFGWHKEDKKRMLQATLNVTDLDHTIRYYKNCFEMKLLRQEQVNPSEDHCTRAIMGFEPEVKSFVLQLTQKEERVDNPIEDNPTEEDNEQPMGFGHISIAHLNVQSLVDTVISNGGTVIRFPETVKQGSYVTRSACAKDPDGYRFELLQRGPTPERICQLMLHVGDINRAINFYEKALGMQLLTKNFVFKGQRLTTIARMGYADEERITVLELTCKDGVREYSKDNGYCQVTIGTNDVQKTSEAVAFAIKLMGGQILEGPGLLPFVRVEVMSFIDPDGWKVVLVNKKDFLTERP